MTAPYWLLSRALVACSVAKAVAGGEAVRGEPRGIVDLESEQERGEVMVRVTEEAAPTRLATVDSRAATACGLGISADVRISTRATCLVVMGASGQGLREAGDEGRE